jgi:hypothetical protein
LDYVSVIYEKLRLLGFSNIPKYNKYLTVFDFEAILSPITPQQDGSIGTEYKHIHIPASVSIISNVAPYDTCKFILAKAKDDGTPDTHLLIKEYLDHLHKISNMAYIRKLMDIGADTIKVIKTEYYNLWKDLMRELRILYVTGFNTSRYAADCS